MQSLGQSYCSSTNTHASNVKPLFNHLGMKWLKLVLQVFDRTGVNYSMFAHVHYKKHIVHLVYVRNKLL